MTTGKEIAKKDATIRELIEGESFKEQIQKALPRHLAPDRFIRIAITAMTKTPKLAQCDKASFFNALLTLSQLGIEPDGRRAHLIPFDNKKKGITEVTLIIDYKGLAELAYNTGHVSYIHADVVCENDEFEFDKGEIKHHKINFKQERGKVYAAYAIVRFKDGTEKAEVMTEDEIDKIRKRSRAAESGPWVTDWSEMAKKTVFRRLSKWIPLSPEQRDIIEADDQQFDPLPQRADVNAKRLAEKFIPQTIPADEPKTVTPSDINCTGSPNTCEHSMTDAEGKWICGKDEPGDRGYCEKV